PECPGAFGVAPVVDGRRRHGFPPTCCGASGATVYRRVPPERRAISTRGSPSLPATCYVPLTHSWPAAAYPEKERTVFATIGGCVRPTAQAGGFVHDDDGSTIDVGSGLRVARLRRRAAASRAEVRPPGGRRNHRRVPGAVQ